MVVLKHQLDHVLEFQKPTLALDEELVDTWKNNVQLAKPFIFSEHVVQNGVKVELNPTSQVFLQHWFGNHVLNLSDTWVPPVAFHLTFKLHEDHPCVIVLLHKLPILLSAFKALFTFKVINEVLEMV